MFLKNISIVNFKNIENLQLDFCENVNCIIGDNGIGKTNTLDAIHHLSMCKSFLNLANDKLNIKYSEDFYVIEGIFDLNDNPEKIYCGLHSQSKKKSFKRNGIEYQRLSDHIGLFPIVYSAPTDNCLIYDTSEIRRKFIDSIISQFDKIYLKNLVSYNHALAQRNILLRKASDGEYIKYENIEIWDMQLADYGTKIYKARKCFIENISEIFQKYYNRISGGKEEVEILYQTKLNNDSLENILKTSLERDKNIGYTGNGIHRDDFEFLLNGNPIKRCGSQGQQKTFLVSLKFAQFEYIKSRLMLKPILLLDDIFDKLDFKRVTVISELVSKDEFGQIFITDTSYQRMPQILKNLNIKHSIYNMSN